MIALLLSLAITWIPATDGIRATWYGRVDGRSCYGGYVNTCPPYRKGETVMYAAVPGFKWKDKPYNAFVCYKDKCVWVTIRDCLCTRRGGKYIDLSPAAFMALAPLPRGALYGVHVYIDYGESPSQRETARPIRPK